MRVFSWTSLLIASLFTTSSWAQSCGSAFTTVYRYDSVRQLVGVISPPASGMYEAVRNTYDPDGRITKIERGALTQCQAENVLPANWSGFTPMHVTEWTYDDTGRLLAEKRSGPMLTQYSYDSVGRLECMAIRMNPAVYNSLPSSACALSTQGSQGPDRITRLVRDAGGQVLNEQRAYGTSIQQNYATHAYTTNGRKDWVEDANGNRTDYAYDGFDRLSRMYFPQTSVGVHAASANDYEQYGYDDNSNRISKRLRSGETITYGFDYLNRVSSKNLAGTTTVTYGYDNFGLNLTAQISGGASISNTFNGFGELRASTSTSSTGPLQLSYDYDAESNRTRVTWPDSTFVQYTYDGRNRMDEVRENGASSTENLLADYGYDVLSRRTYVSRGNGTTTALYYDGGSRLSNLTQDLASTSRDLSFGFSYNSANQVTDRTLSNDAYSYFSLTQSTSYTRDGLNRYATVGGVTYGYDGRGNLTSDGARTFAYDLENHLLSVSEGAALVGLAYDPNGRLLTSTSGGTTTRYLYDGDKLVAEYDGTTLMRRYVHGADIDEPVVWYEGAGLTDRRWLHTDHQGSVVATSGGEGVGTVYAYGTYGEPAYDNWGGSRFRYTGQIMLPEARLYHYKARVYDPLLGRFLQTDPVGYDDDVNLYAYVGNDPFNKIDPTGLAELLWTARDKVTLVFPVTVDQSKGSANFSMTAVSQQVSADFSGQVNIGGTMVTISTAVTAIPLGDPAVTSRNAATVTVDPNIASTGPGRAHIADGIGGKDIQVGPTDGPAVVSHELGHNAGAGDQYVGGVGANGNKVTSPPPNSANSVMRDLGGPANDQTRMEIINSSRNVNTCNPGISATTGRC